MSQLSQGLCLFLVFSAVGRALLSEGGSARRSCPGAGGKRATRSLPGARQAQTSRGLRHAGSKRGQGIRPGSCVEELSRDGQQPPGHGQPARVICSVPASPSGTCRLAAGSGAVASEGATGHLGAGAWASQCPADPSPRTGALCALARLSRGTSRSVLGCYEFSEITYIPGICGWRKKTSSHLLPGQW